MKALQRIRLRMQQYDNNAKKTAALYALLTAVIIVSVPLTSFLGSAQLGIADVLQVYASKIRPDAPVSIPKAFINIVWELRLPRALLGICVGGGLAVCGAVMQALTANVMAEPYTLGVASGASFMAALSIATMGNIAGISGITPSIGAFIGAFAAMMLVYGIATDTYGASNARLILTGIGISMICAAFTQLVITFVGNEHKVRSIVYWSMGSLAGARWDTIALPVIALTVGGALLFLHAEQINLLAMGKDTAAILGTNVGALQKKLILIISAITGVMVASAGTIGFIGLIIPHIVRFFIGADNRKTLPVILLTGSLFTMWMDAVARTVMAPQELPIGVLTSLLGGPFFLFLLKKHR